MAREVALGRSDRQARLAPSAFCAAHPERDPSNRSLQKTSLLCSAGALDPGALAEPRVRHIIKPYDAASLRLVVRELLDAP